MGSIVLEMNRLARYFKDDLVGVWVFISYLISIDVSEYYSNIIVKMHQLSRNWMEKIKTVHQIKKVNRQKAKVDSIEILKHPEFMELRNYIEEI